MVFSFNNFENDYQHHRLRLCNAKSAIHTFGTKVNKELHIRKTQLRQDGATFDALAKQHFHFFKKMNSILRLSSGHEDLYTSSSAVNDCHLKCRQSTHFREVAQQINRIEKENNWLGNRILSAKSSCQGASPISYVEKVEKEQISNFEVPFNILSKYANFNVRIPDDKEILRQLLRPKIFIDLGINGFRRLRRFVIELFTEACPQVVLELVRACKNKNTAALQVIRIFPGLWLESELKLKDDKLNTSRIEYDMRALDHSECAGILSFAKTNLKGFRFGVLNFSISFKSLSALNGKRVGFGRLLVGQRDHNILQEFGTKNGKMTKPINILGCGVL